MSPASATPRTNGDVLRHGRGAAVEGHSRYLDEDVSALDLPVRILALAEGPGANPVLERVRLLAGCGWSLDEFFQLRGEQLRRTSSGSPSRARAVRVRVQELLSRQSRLFRHLIPVLAAEGIRLCDTEWLPEADRRLLTVLFRDRLLPVIAPMTTEPGRPLPPPANLSLNLAVWVRDDRGRRRFGSVELPPVLPRLLALSSGRLIPLEQVVSGHLPALFEGFSVESHGLFRVTRHAAAPAGPDDLLASVEARLHEDRQGTPVRLEVEPRLPEDLLRRLAGELDLSAGDVYTVHGLLGPADLRSLAEADRPDLKSPRIEAVTHRRLTGYDRSSPDVHPPYDSFAASVEALLRQAALDPEVLAVKSTLYRPSPDQPLVRALVRAAERGTHVVVLVELGARLGERESLASARALERAGAHVVYGLVDLRTHCPVTLVVRQAAAGVVHQYSVVCTAHHDARRTPELLALLSADPALGADLTDLFNYLTGYSRPPEFRTLMVGPGAFRPRLLEMIRQEAAAGSAGRIALKVGRLVDHEVVDALYAASGQGTPVDLVVTGACAVRPGVAGLSENVRVVAPTGRRFEGSRLFAFGTGGSASWCLSSGDLATRNLDRQVDIALPVRDLALRSRLEATLGVLVAQPSWELGPDGAWRGREGGAEEALQRLAGHAAGARPSHNQRW